MKRLILVLLLMPIFARSQTSQSDRWSFIFEDKTTSIKYYIDTQTIEHVDYFEAHKNVYSVWIKSFSDFSNGIYHKEDITHMVIDMDSKQIGVKSYIGRKDGTAIANKQFVLAEWSDIIPETNGEILLNYCKNLRK